MSSRPASNVVRTAPLCAFMVALVLTGCRDDASQPARFIPTAETARQAVVAALESWQNDKPTRKLPTGQNVTVADSQRRPGQTLVGYKIVGEAPLEDGRRFVVRLVLANPDQEERAQYLVIGIDPLWVVRKEDYDMITHWDHPMPEPHAAE